MCRLLPLFLTTSISLLIVRVSGIGLAAYFKAYDAMESQLQQQYRASSQAAVERLSKLRTISSQCRSVSRALYIFSASETAVWPS